jgi:spore photoproduct lyase
MKRKIVFIKKYDYGKGVFDLGDYVISYASSCHFGCEYCYLKYAKVPEKIVIYDNLEVLAKEIRELFANRKEKKFYFNLGETTDAFLSEKHLLIIDKIAEIIKKNAWAYQKEAILELRTKTENIFRYSLKKKENLIYVYAVSLLPEIVIKEFEKNTASLEKRIATIKKAQELGFLIGLRFEPIILYPVLGITYEDVLNSLNNLISEYQKIFIKLKEILDLRFLSTISLGTLRLIKRQYKDLREKRSKLAFFEMILCPDKKYRYSRPIRVFIYENLIKKLREILGDEITDKIYLTAEFPYIWKAVNLPFKKLIDFY